MSDYTTFTELRELLTDIQEWMVDNDYECGPQGSAIFDRISDALNAEEAA